FWNNSAANYSFITEMIEGFFTFISNTFNILPLLVLFALIRLLSTLCFGVSISEFLLGIKSNGNGIWARIGGVFRVFIGFVTGPFLIFDFPAVFSRRTFKEVVTYTNTYIGSKFI